MIVVAVVRLRRNTKLFYEKMGSARKRPIERAPVQNKDAGEYLSLVNLGFSRIQYRYSDEHISFMFTEVRKKKKGKKSKERKESGTSGDTSHHKSSLES